jgi:hypothetical protein
LALWLLLPTFIFYLLSTFHNFPLAFDEPFARLGRFNFEMITFNFVYLMAVHACLLEESFDFDVRGGK